MSAHNENNCDDAANNLLADFTRIANAVAIAMEATYQGVDKIVHAMESFQEDFKNRNSNATNNDVSGNLNSEGTADDNNDDANMSLASMENVEHRLSAEIVLPRIKAFLEKFTNYVEQNGEIMPTEDKERYAMQLELYKMIESVFETEKPDGMPGTTEQGSKIVLDVMAKLRDYGEPPKEILDSFEVLLHMSVDNEAEPQCPTI